MDQQAGQIIKQRSSNPNDQNSKLALQAADLLSRWANLEKRARESQPTSSKKLKQEERAAPPSLSREESFPSTDDFGKSVTNWLEALKNANSTLDFIEYPATDSNNWLQRLDVNSPINSIFKITFKSVERWYNNAKKPLEDLLMEGKQLANTGRMELQVHEAILSLYGR